MSASEASVAPQRSETARYTGVAIALHWLIAIAIVVLILVGWNMSDMADDNPAKEELYQMHKSFGIVVLILTLARIAWRFMNPPPPLPADFKGWETTLSHITHIVFYGLMLAMPLSGWALVSTSYEFDIATVLFGVISWPDLPLGFLANEAGHGSIEFVHSKLAWLAIGLIGLHVAGALKHEITADAGVLKRMLPGLFGRTDGPLQAGRGTLMAFGGALAVFIAIAALPLMQRGPAGAVPLAQPAAAANWQVDAEQSHIAFSGLNNGQPYTGNFEAWTASILFDPERLPTSSVTVTVDMASAVANQRSYTDTLRQREWFNVGDHPTAEVTLSSFMETDAGYSAAATVTVKDIAVTLPFTFTLDIEGDTARMEGQSELSRAAFDLGMASDPGADWVADEIQVDVTVVATRIGD